MIALGVILAAYENSLSRQSWRSVNDATARYLHFLEEQGYELSHVEKRAGGDATGPAPTEPGIPVDVLDVEDVVGEQSESGEATE
ncbi:hypothetical protein [Micromonospora sp. U56]|uniref:hypothetical protein n=1 Tax=Micromonospora sp. U56 TaxID=2824900 RepID=UPI001B37CA58|nr:hypothetical protein [Micromonospora sp. U56]